MTYLLLRNLPDPEDMTPSAAVSLSVIIPTYNRAGFVRDCLIALRESGVPDLEIIVVDDGSTDNTEQVVAETNPQAMYIRQANRGPAAARNNGFAHSHGRYVGFLDCDDEWLAGAPARALALLKEFPQIDVLFAEARMGNRQEGFVSWIESSGQAAFWELPHRRLRQDFLWLDNDPFFRRMAYRNPVFIGAVILKREAFEQIGQFDPELCGAADWNLWLRLATQYNFAFWNQPLAIYTKHLEGMSNDHDGMSKEFCWTLKKLLQQTPLDKDQQKYIQQRLRHHLFSYAYRAYNRGDYPEARNRFADLLHTTGWEIRGSLYWLLTRLPFGMAGWLRKAKHLLTGGSTETITDHNPGMATR